MSRDSERRMREAKDAAERASQRKSEFLSSVSHEIRTPLNTVLGMAELLGETALDQRQRRYVHTLQRASEHLLALIDEVLDLTRIEAGGVTLEDARFDLHEVAESAIEIVRVHGRRKKLDLGWRADASVPQFVRGDARRLRQVLVNLLGNAVKFTDVGRVHLAITRDGGANDKLATLHFAVADTGIGIHNDRLPHIFSSFVQGDGSISRRYGGFGLGLKISTSIVERMGGRIWAESVVGEGSCFHVAITFAVERPSHPSLADPATTHLRVRGPNGARLRVLIVDDSEDNRTLLGEYLNGAGADPHFADDGASAIRKVTTEPFDVVVMDLQMPELDGFEATREILRVMRQSERPAPPIIALSAHAVQETLTRSMEAGATLQLTKPIRKRVFLEAVARAVGGMVSEDSTAPSGRGDDLTPLLPQFFANRRKDVATIAAALERGETDVIATLAHNMRGTGKSFGFPEITEIGDALETAVTEGRLDEARALHARLSRLVTNLTAQHPGIEKRKASGTQPLTRPGNPPSGTGTGDDE